MAEEIQELVVRMKPEGVEETEEALEAEQETFEETADTAEEESGNLETFSRKWQGAMTVIVGALALAASGLASQVPVVQDLMDGLMAVVEGIAIQVDTRLRPVLSDVVDDLFDLAEAIGEGDGEGVLAKLIDLNTTLKQLEGRTAVVVVDLVLGGFTLDFGDARIQESFRDYLAESDPLDFLPLSLPLKIGRAFVNAIMSGIFEEWPGFMEFMGQLFGSVEENFDTLASALASKMREWGGEWVAQFRMYLGHLRDAFDRWTVNAQANYQSFWTNLAIATVEGANRVLSRLESFVNKYITMYNNLAPPGMAQLGTVSMGSLSTGGLQRNLSNIESRRSSQLGAINERGETRRQNIYADQQEMVVRFEPAEFERFVSGELSEGPANRGRNPGVR